MSTATVKSLSAAASTLDLIESAEVVESLRKLERSTNDVRDQMVALAVVARAARESIAKAAADARASKRQADADVSEAVEIATQLAADLLGAGEEADPTRTRTAAPGPIAPVAAASESSATSTEATLAADLDGIESGAWTATADSGREAMLKAALAVEQEQQDTITVAATLPPTPSKNGRKGRRPQQS